MRRLLLLAIVAILLSGMPALGAVRFVKWDKPTGTGNQGNVAALDTATGKVVWQRKLPKEANFVVETTVGILVGTDDKAVYLLDRTDGHVVWRRVVGTEVTSFHGESIDGLLVSHGEEIYWLLDHAGELKHKW